MHLVKREAGTVRGNRDIGGEYGPKPCIETLALHDGGLRRLGPVVPNGWICPSANGLLPAAQAGNTSGMSTPSEKSEPLAVSKMQRMLASASSPVKSFASSRNIAIEKRLP
jgi:hypothetical protein